VLERLDEYAARTVDVEGLTYREGLNAVFVGGGVAGHVVPGQGSVAVNFRFPPDRNVADAEAPVREVFAGYEVELLDAAPASRPGLDAPLAQAVVAAVGGQPRAKYGWTDVARFGELGIPAVNFGPGDPNLAHTPGESAALAAVAAAEA